MAVADPFGHWKQPTVEERPRKERRKTSQIVRWTRQGHTQKAGPMCKKRAWGSGTRRPHMSWRDEGHRSFQRRPAAEDYHSLPGEERGSRPRPEPSRAARRAA